MPNSGHRWTEQEERDALAYEYEAFEVMYPAITRDAYRIRRAALLRAQRPKPNRLRALIHRFVCG